MPGCYGRGDVEDDVPSEQVSLMELHDVVHTTAAAALAALVGTLAGRRLVDHGLRQLDVGASTRWVRPASYAAGALAGVAAVLSVRHAGSWWLMPSALAWAYALTAGAVCDGFTQRVPTPLVRQATVVTGVLILIASAVTEHWRWTVLAAAAAGAAGLIFVVCWRFLGAGYGDVRIAILGGIGLARPTQFGVGVAIAVFAVITLSLTVATLAKGGNRHTRFPYGPAIAAAFFAAAVV